MVIELSLSTGLFVLAFFVAIASLLYTFGIQIIKERYANDK